MKQYRDGSRILEIRGGGGVQVNKCQVLNCSSFMHKEFASVL